LLHFTHIGRLEHRGAMHKSTDMGQMNTSGPKARGTHRFAAVPTHPAPPATPWLVSPAR
jgi:hypothetical protein